MQWFVSTDRSATCPKREPILAPAPRLWDHELQSCFDLRDFVFAGHQTDRRLAALYLLDLIARNVSWPVLQRQVDLFLRSTILDADVLNDRVQQVEKHFRPWLHE